MGEVLCEFAVFDMNCKSKTKTGFSLVEILVVVAILAILIALIASSFIRQIAKGNDSRRKADLNRIKIALEEYEKDNNCYPNAGYMDKCGPDADVATRPYLSNMPCDPVTKETYAYENDGAICSRWYRIYTVLQNSTDPQITANVGPEGAYNFYVSSENAPAATTEISKTTSPTATSTLNPGTYHYGCINGVCQEIPLDNQGNPACVSRTFDTPNCNGNDCADPKNACY